MNVLIIGSGGREHALAWKCAQSPLATEVLVAPGNAGTAREPGVRNVAVPADDIEALARLAMDEAIGLTIVGPEAPLVAGIVDRGEEATCEGDLRTLSTAAESYFAQVGGTVIPATGADADRYERTLMNQGLVREPSELYDINSDGQIVISPTSRCTTL